MGKKLTSMDHTEANEMNLIQFIDIYGENSHLLLLGAGVTLNFYPLLRNEPALFSTLKNEPKQLNNDPFHWKMNRLIFQPLDTKK